MSFEAARLVSTLREITSRNATGFTPLSPASGERGAKGVGQIGKLFFDRYLARSFGGGGRPGQDRTISNERPVLLHGQRRPGPGRRPGRGPADNRGRDDGRPWPPR